MTQRERAKWEGRLLQTTGYWLEAAADRDEWDPTDWRVQKELRQADLVLTDSLARIREARAKEPA